MLRYSPQTGLKAPWLARSAVCSDWPHLATSA